MSSADYTTLHTLPLSRLRTFAQNPRNHRRLGAYLARMGALPRARVLRAIATP